MTCSAGCWTWALVLGVIWWLLGSALVYATWNKVIVAVTNARAAQFWHALLLVFTLGILCAPHHMLQQGKCGMGCQSKGHCPCGKADKDLSHPSHMHDVKPDMPE